MLAGQQRPGREEWQSRVLTAMGPGERRTAEAHAHGQKRPQEESETMHKTFVCDSVSILKA